MSKFKKITATILAASMLIPSISAKASTKKYIEDVSISSKVEVLITADSAKFDSLVSMLDAKSNDISAKFTRYHSLMELLLFQMRRLRKTI